MLHTSLKSIPLNITHYKNLTSQIKEIIVEKSEKRFTLTLIEYNLNIMFTYIVTTDSLTL